jgi:hypothetical protein
MFYYYELTYYYRFLFLLIPILILDMIINQQFYYHSKKCYQYNQKYEIKVNYEYTQYLLKMVEITSKSFYAVVAENPPKFYNIINISFIISTKMSLSKREHDGILVIYRHHHLRMLAANNLAKQIDTHPRSNLVLMLLSLVFLIT